MNVERVRKFICRHLWVILVLVGMLEVEGYGKLRPLLTTESQNVPLVARSVDPFANQELISEGEEVFRVVRRVLGKIQREDVRFILDWSDGFSQKVEDQRLAYESSFYEERGVLVFKVLGFGSVAESKVPLRRSLAITLLQAMALGEEEFKEVKLLRDPPLWLVEGVIQPLSEEDEGVGNRIVARYGHMGYVPKLSKLQRQEELSDYYLERFWEQAFMARLVQEATRRKAERATLLAWNRKYVFEKTDDMYWGDRDSVQSWWEDAVKKEVRKRIPFFTWDETASRLRDALLFSVRKTGEVESLLFSIEDLPEDLIPDGDSEYWQNVLVKLTRVKAQAHPMWTNVVLGYQGALQSWMVGDYQSYQRYLKEAQEEQKGLSGMLSASGDYLNWVEVNYPVDVVHGDMLGIRYLVREMEFFRRRNRDVFEKELDRAGW